MNECGKVVDQGKQSFPQSYSFTQPWFTTFFPSKTLLSLSISTT